MKINFNDISKLYKNSMIMQNQRNTKSVEQQAKNGKFDQIQITKTRPSTKSLEDQFISSMTKQVLQDVARGNSEERINDLKKQVQEGTYSFNVNDIVSKILLEKGE